MIKSKIVGYYVIVYRVYIVTCGILFEHFGTLLYVVEDGLLWNNIENKLEDIYCKDIFSKILVAFVNIF